MDDDWERRSAIDSIKRRNRWLEKSLPFIFSGKRIIDVAMSDHGIGEHYDILHTDNLMECLGVALYDKVSGRGVLAHMLPSQEPEKVIGDMLSKLNYSQDSNIFACVAGEMGPPDLPSSGEVRGLLTKRGIHKTYTELGSDESRALCLDNEYGICYVIRESTRTFTPVKLDGEFEKYLRLPSSIRREDVWGVYSW